MIYLELISGSSLQNLEVPWSLCRPVQKDSFVPLEKCPTGLGFWASREGLLLRLRVCGVYSSLPVSCLGQPAAGPF